MTDATDVDASRKFKALERLSRKTTNVVIHQLYTHVLNAPLLFEPVRGDALLGAYLRADSDEIYSGDESRGLRRVGKIAVIDISGALVSRPMPGPSGAGPQSYEDIRAEFDEGLADATVEAIVLRLDSPGGFVSGCFDLTDHIFASRGKKPIVAVVDDIAFSACYAIASACDEIWLTRTGGVGSVGVIAHHVDQSGFDKALGVKWTAVYAGAHKNDFSPHEPLGDAGRQQMQSAVARIYDLFTDSVSRYRSLDQEAVRATEALVYEGEKAIAIGFADRLGTFEDALTALGERLESRATGSNFVTAGLSGTQPKRSTRAMENEQQKPALTRETIAADHPAIAEAFRKEGHEAGHKAGFEAGVKAGAEQERTRIKAIHELPSTGHKALVDAAMFDGKTTAAETALQILSAEKGARTAAVDTLRNERVEPVRPSADTEQAPKGEDKRPLETRCKEAWERDPELRAEFGDSYERYFAFEQAQANGQVRMFNPGARK